MYVQRTLRYGTLRIDTYRSTVCYGFLHYVTLREDGKQALGVLLLGVLEVFWFYATLIIFVDNNNNNNTKPHHSALAVEFYLALAVYFYCH